MLLERLSKRLIREVRSCKTVIEAIGWLREKYGEDGTQQQVTATEQGGPQKMVGKVQCYCCRKQGHVKRHCPDKPGSEINSGRGKRQAQNTIKAEATRDTENFQKFSKSGWKSKANPPGVVHRVFEFDNEDDDDLQWFRRTERNLGLKNPTRPNAYGY
jgi:hypothetical protein